MGKEKGEVPGFVQKVLGLTKNISSQFPSTFHAWGTQVLFFWGRGIEGFRDFFGNDGKKY